MNRFRTKKKAKEAHGDEDSSLPSLPFMKNKKKPVETKPEIDLSSALPSNDDFRTSLLMPKLSARFSMLREQDDPNSKLGKANDDSVLFPRRQSRLNLFGHNQLNDIAEISSLTGSARPSMTIGRTSYASGEGYATDDDPSPGTSIMSRQRPGEGNNLFGGRQKVYKIPVSSTPRNNSVTDSIGSGSGKGRLVYDDDVSLSAWQKLKQKEKEQEQEENNTEPVAEEAIEKKDALDTPAATQSIGDRKSTSTTSTDPQHRNSGPVPSPTDTPNKPGSNPFGMERNMTKTRRLYGQGLELQNQQPSVLSRIESFNRQRSATNDPAQIKRSISKSALNLNEKFQPKTSPLYASSSFRPASPPPSSTSSISGIADISNKKPTGNGPGQGYTLPLSPPVSESDEMSLFAAAILPEDRGKATATGLFNKPATQYDENQFTRRQLQMHEGRNTPPMRRLSPSRSSSGWESTGRPRGLSTTSYQSKAESAMSRCSGSQDGSRRSDDRSRTGSVRKPSPSRPIDGTFLANMNESESEDDNGRSLDSTLPPATYSSDDIHPALRTSVDSADSHTFKTPNTYVQTDPRDLNTIEENVTAENPPSAPTESEGPDSPTLGPGLGLSGLVRTHLRQDSDKSSILPPPSPGLLPTSLEINRDLIAPPISRSASHATSIRSNPFEYDDWAKGSSTTTLDKTIPPPAPAPTSVPPPAPAPSTTLPQPPGQPDFTSMSLRAKQMLGQAAALSAHGRQATRPVDNERSEEPSSVLIPPKDEARSGHHRTGSSDTQVDREEFANELAERRRKVQEKLRSIAESGSRPSSPGPSHRIPDYSPARSGNGLGVLKRNTPVGRTEPAAKHMRVLGMDPMASSSSPNLASRDMFGDEEERMRRERSRQHPRPTSPYVGSHQSRSRQHHAHPHLASRTSQEEMYGPFHDDPYRRSERRDRSGSEGSGRSKSRPRYREDLESVMEGSEAINRQSRDERRGPSVPSSVPSSTRPSLEGSDRAGGRFRSNSRPIMPSHLDTALNSSLQAGHPALIGNAPRPSPITPYSANTTPPLYETSPTTSTGPSFLNAGGQRTQSLAGHKRVVDKATISEPKLLSTTNHVPTVGLPPGASLSNGSAPPIPPMNPRRRRQTTTQTILEAFKGSSKTDTIVSSDTSHPPEEHSTFSDDDKPSRPRQRLRKISSDGGNLNGKGRPPANADSPAVPHVPGRTPMDGGMF